MSDFREIEIEIFPYRFQSRKLGLSRAFEFRQLSLVFPRATAAAPTRTIPSHTGNFCYVSRAIHSSLVRILFLALVQNRANKTNWKEQSRGDVHRDRIRKGITRLFSSTVQYFPFLVSSFITCIGFRGFYRFRCESRYINCSIARKEKKEGKKETAYNDSF